jgi:hypothetical protein
VVGAVSETVPDNVNVWLDVGGVAEGNVVAGSDRSPLPQEIADRTPTTTSACRMDYLRAA